MKLGWIRSNANPNSYFVAGRNFFSLFSFCALRFAHLLFLTDLFIQDGHFSFQNKRQRKFQVASIKVKRLKSTQQNRNMAASQQHQAWSRLLVPGVLLGLVVLNSLGSSHVSDWNFGDLKRDLNVLINILNDEVPFNASLISEDTPVHCVNQGFCCGIWNVSSDSWWIHHPQWEVVSENSEIFCFSPMKDTEKSRFLEEVHWTQWQIDISNAGEIRDLQSLQTPLSTDYNFTVNCSDMRSSVSINSGYGAAISFLLASFWEAHTQQKPFQTIQQWPWLYANDDANSTWIKCPVHDQSCFYLPVSPCDRTNKKQARLEARPDPTNTTERSHWLWLEEYLTRPNQATRQELQRLRQSLEEKLQDGVLCMHVRRGDAGSPQPPFRRYAAVQEYLDLAKPENNATIFLMSDDASTIEEVQKYHSSKFQWVYTDKIRTQGVKRGFNNHVPEGSSGPDELAYITLEQSLASSYCGAFVYGNSGYAYTLIEKINLKGRDVHEYYLETRISPENISSEVTVFAGKPDEREAHLMQRVHSIYEQRQML